MVVRSALSRKRLKKSLARSTMSWVTSWMEKPGRVSGVGAFDFPLDFPFGPTDGDPWALGFASSSFWVWMRTARASFRSLVPLQVLQGCSLMY